LGVEKPNDLILLVLVAGSLQSIARLAAKKNAGHLAVVFVESFVG